MGKHTHLYKLAVWRRLRSRQLIKQPLCEYCLESEEVTAADTVDHITPHRGDMKLFTDPLNLQSLCSQCHNKRKQREEAGQDVIVFGADGWPLA